MSSNRAGLFTIIGGSILLFFFIPHTLLGYTGITNDLLKDHVSGVTITNIQNIWIFSSITMLLAGIWAIILGTKIKKGDFSNRGEQILLGAAILLFGIIALCHPFPNWGMSIFIAPGLLIFLPAILLTTK